MPEKRKAEKLPSERGHNDTPLREVVHCALPGASCGQQIFNLLQSSQGKLHLPYAGSASYPFVDLPGGITFHCKLFPPDKFSEIQLYFFYEITYNRASDKSGLI